MTTPTAVVLGFVVVGRGKDKRGADREEKLSRRYASKAAAEEFMRLARASGRDCWIRDEHGVDEAGPL